MKAALADGKNVHLGELGSMRVNISSEGKLTAKEVTSSTIKGAKTIFTPSAELKDMMNALKYEKIK